VLEGNHGKNATRDETAANGLVFQHFAYALSKHVDMKEKLYGPKFAGLRAGWERLQANKDWPANASQFLPVAFKGCPIDKIF